MRTQHVLPAIAALSLLLAGALTANAQEHGGWGGEPPPPPPPEGGFGPPPHGGPGGPPHGPGARGHGPGGMRGPGVQRPDKQRWIQRLRQENPEEFERLRRLREENPDEFRREARERIQERMAQPGPGQGPRHPAAESERECHELTRLYHDAQTAEEKERIRADLSKALEESFNKRLEAQKERLARLEKEIERIRTYVEEREANRAKICGTRLQELTQDPALRWDR